MVGRTARGRVERRAPREARWDIALDPAIAAQVAHLFDATLAQVLSGEVAGRPEAPAMDRADVRRDDAEVPGPGGPVGIRTYRHRDVDPGIPAPALVWVHGGGWRYGGIDMPESDSVAQVVAAQLGIVVVSVDYRLAPEHTHPAALDDVVAVHAALVRDAAAHGIDPDRIALGGGSAGAHLATLAALAHRSTEPDLAALWLAYPVTDPVDGPWGPRDEACPPVIWTDRDATTGMFATYLGVEPDELDAVAGPDVVPAKAPLAGLPPTLVTTAACDGLAPQGAAFVELLHEAGVDVTHQLVDGVLHGYLNTVGAEPRAAEALEDHLDWLGEVLGRRS